MRRTNHRECNDLKGSNTTNNIEEISAIADPEGTVEQRSYHRAPATWSKTFRDSDTQCPCPDFRSAAAGMLVTASLAPPAEIVGIAIAIGRWNMSIDAVFLLLLQLVGIHLSASLIFQIYGLSPQGARYQRGKRRVFPSDTSPKWRRKMLETN